MSNTLRTTPDRVKEVLGNDYDSDASPSLARYIKGASLITDRVSSCAAGKGLNLTTEELREVETWIAAHLYTKSDPVYTSRTTSAASGAFVRAPNNPEPYKDGAITIDPSGCVNAALNQLRAGGFWLGKAPSEQVDYKDRD